MKLEIGDNLTGILKEILKIVIPLIIGAGGAGWFTNSHNDNFYAEKLQEKDTDMDELTQEMAEYFEFMKQVTEE